MGYALPITVEMSDMTCGKCGIAFAVPETWRQEKQKNGGSWYCPNGCCRAYRESDTDKLKKRLAEERERHERTIARLNEAQASEARTAKKLKLQQKRHAAGTCPCCKRTFQQLARHMVTKHPGYSP